MNPILPLILFLSTILIVSCSMNKMVQIEFEKILSEVEISDARIIGEDDMEYLPQPVQNWLRKAGIIGKQEIRSGWLRQVAKLKMKPNQERWLNAEAEQYFTTQKPAFIWTVKLKMSPFISIRGRDKFIEGKGEMLIRMNSLINVVNERGEKLDEATLQRYFGEIVWYPSAAMSEYIKWEEIDENIAKATINFRGIQAEGVFYFNENGDFIKFSTMRYRENKPDSERYEWIITANEYAELDGVRIPSKLEATWRLDDGDWTWIKLEIVDMKYNVTNVRK